jgi:hypothetical protein
MPQRSIHRIVVPNLLKTTIPTLSRRTKTRDRVTWSEFGTLLYIARRSAQRP